MKITNIFITAAKIQNPWVAISYMVMICFVAYCVFFGHAERLVDYAVKKFTTEEHVDKELNKVETEEDVRTQQRGSIRDDSSNE